MKFLFEPDIIIKGKELSFEISIPNARMNNANSFIDVIIDGTKYEVKNCQSCVTSKTILTQFIERDLFNAATLNDITKWKIFEQKYSKVQFLEHLQDNSVAIKNLGFERVKSFFPNDELMVSSNFVNRFISKFDDESLFKLIFK